MIKLNGKTGSIYNVYQTNTGTWAWSNSKGEGFTNESLKYILEYLAETKGVKL